MPKVHLVDGTYELFRAYFGAPSYVADGREIGATRALLTSLTRLLQEPEVTHVGIAFDHVIESFRNQLFDGYKTGDGIDPELLGQFGLAERAASALGLVIWPMVEFETDDALATAAHILEKDPAVSQVVIVSPDKDFAQCVINDRVIFWDRARDKRYDNHAVREKWGVPPTAMADWLALVGDSADGIPGIPRWGAKSAAAVLARYGALEAIPVHQDQWDIKVRGAAALAENLRGSLSEAKLYKELATLRRDVPLEISLEALRWEGVNRPMLEPLCRELHFERFLNRLPQV